MALIRLQWWREVVEGTRKAHEVATPLSALLEAGVLDAGELLSVLDARERTELVDTWRRGGTGCWPGPARWRWRPGGCWGRRSAGLRALGAGYGAAGVLRNTAALARAGRACCRRSCSRRTGCRPRR